MDKHSLEPKNTRVRNTVLQACTTCHGKHPVSPMRIEDAQVSGHSVFGSAFKVLE